MFKRNNAETVEVGVMRSLFLIPVLLIGAVVSFPVSFISNSRWQRRERRFLKTMDANGRLMNWPDFVHEIDQNRGTTIIERISIKGRTLWWWTPDDVYAKSPHPVEGLSSLFPDPVFAPFYEWCRETYTNATSGQAMLVSCTSKQRRSFKASLSNRRAVTMWQSQVDRVPGSDKSIL
jgi:hypothetical protein